MPTPTTTRPGVVETVNVPDPLRPIPPPPRNMSRAYSRELPPISADDAAVGEPLFSETPTTTGAAAKPTITLATTVQHRGRLITITTTDMTADQFCDLLDRRGFASPEQPQQWQTLPDGTPICPKHHAPMRLREKQGDSWYSHNVGTKEQPIYCKGYKGLDSSGYDK